MELRTPQELKIMTEGGRRLGAVLQELKREVKVGVTTLALDRAARALIIDGGDIPAFLNYRPAGARRAYPYTLCTSVNDVVVHGQPSEYALREGDIIKLDLGLKHQGFYLDAAITVPVGRVSADAKKLIAVTEESLYAGIKEAKPGRTLGDIGYAIERVVRKNKFSVAEGLTGHGIGRALHEDPVVFNVGDRGTGQKLVPGMVIAIEPMIAIGGGSIVQLKDEGYGTVDRSWVAHFEHTVAITEKGPMILTKA
ncbi:MAG TPA: type I methionyl aminopeptidase [Candidatus Paceibacterota bacterium]|nr:type I methionyl aminopeptidase [Candidatus Paceibacterota bacterium]